MAIPKPTLAAVKLLEELTPVGPMVSSKKVFGQPAVFVNGNMFFGVFGENVFVRLPDSERTEIETIPGFVPFEPMPGRAMRGYYVVPKSILENRVQSRRWVTRSMEFVAELPPKKAKPRPK
jgi:TfoX/Sxy family transcriptional regulator of competence genes